MADTKWNVWVAFKWSDDKDKDWDQWWSEVKAWKGSWGAMKAWCSTGEWDGWFALETKDPDVAKDFSSKLHENPHVARTTTQWWYEVA